MLKYLGCQTELGLTAQFAGLEPLNDAVIISGINDHSYILPVLGGSTDHGRAADVDVLDGLLQSDAVLEDGLLEGIEVDGNHINGGNAQLFQLSHVLRIGAHRQNTGMNSRMQGLDTTI